MTEVEELSKFSEPSQLNSKSGGVRGRHTPLGDDLERELSEPASPTGSPNPRPWRNSVSGDSHPHERARGVRRTLSHPHRFKRSSSNDRIDGSSTPHSKPAARATHDHYHREFKLVDRSFLRGGDYHVPLTPSQLEHYNNIFELNDHAGHGHLKVAEGRRRGLHRAEPPCVRVRVAPLV